MVIPGLSVISQAPAMLNNFCHHLKEIVMKTTIKKLTLLVAVFAPFFMTGAALIVLPDPWGTLRNTSGVDWIWLILLGAMMLGIYYFLAVYLEDEEEIAEEFQRLDLDRDGFISREDTNTWPNLRRLFDKFDT